MITNKVSYLDELEYLLHLDGEVFPMENGYWVKFEVKRVDKSESRPYGIRYSLTLHDKTNRRVIWYDNAHSYKSTKKYGANKESYDHIHKQMNVISYEFDTLAKLIEDFWVSVENYMSNN